MTVNPNVTALNEVIEAQVAANWITSANARVDDWKDANAYGFVTFAGGAAVNSRTPDLDAMNAALTQVEADWTAQLSANLTAWLAANGYAYVNGVAVQSVSEDIVALNTAIETQVEAEWVRNAQNEFYAWLTDKGYTEDVSNATASIVGVDVDISALNTAVEQALQAAHVVDAQDEFQRWLTSKSYAYVTGVTIDRWTKTSTPWERRRGVPGGAKWIADADAALQAWLAARGLDGTVIAAVSSSPTDMAALNANIDAQTVDAWVAAENAAMNAWLVSNGYDRVTALTDISLDGTDAAALRRGIPLTLRRRTCRRRARRSTRTGSPPRRGSLRACFRVEFGIERPSPLEDASISTSPNVAELNTVIERLVEQNWIATMNAELQQWLGDHGYGDVAIAVDAVDEDFAVLNAKRRVSSSGARLDQRRARRARRVPRVERIRIHRLAVNRQRLSRPRGYQRRHPGGGGRAVDY